MSTIIDILNKKYKNIFEENWSFHTGGMLIGLLSIITFIFARPWGVVGGIRNIGDWFFFSVGVYDTPPISFWGSTSSALTMGLLLGALVAALMARQFAIRVPSFLEIFKGAAGGVLLGIGATFAGGCNVGGFYSAVSAQSLSGFAMMIGLLLGAFAGLKYLYWELEHLPQKAGPTQPLSKEKETETFRYQPLIGLCLLVFSLFVHRLYTLDGYIIPGALLLCGLAFGFVLHRSRFCFARCFREPFMTGDPSATQAVVISLLISVIGFAVIKWAGLRSEWASVPASFGIGGLVGGFIFGFGMLLAGGCGSGCVWRAAEGQVKLVTALVFYALSASLVKMWVRTLPELRWLIGQKFYLPQHFGYVASTLFIIVVLLIWYVVVSWNEETEKLVIQL